MPPSPKQPRFLEGKNENVAAVPERARAAGGDARAGGLRGVLEHRHAQRLDLGDRSHVAEQVHRDHRLRARSERGAHRLGGHAVGVRVDVAEHRRRARRRDRLGGGVEGERGHHHLVARPDAHRAQRDRDRLGAVGHADRVLAPQ